MAWGSTGCTVKTSKQSASTILFARQGAATVRQTETVETKEVRGLTEESGEGLAAVSDSTVQTAYYAHIDGLTFAITVVTGWKEEWGAARKDESGQWVATCRKTTYTSNVGSVPAWGTTPLDAEGKAVALSAAGVSRTVGRDKSSSLVYTFAGMRLITTIETVNVEYRYVADEAAAQAIVAANSTVADYVTVSTHVESQGSALPAPYAYFAIPYGTEKYASARYVSPSEGWCVSVTAKTHGFVEGNGWHT